MPAAQKRNSRLQEPALVLVIEDIAEHVQLITEVLERECAPVFVQAVDSFKEAFSHLKKNHYDLITCGGTIQDEKLGSVIKELLQAAKETPFLVITGSGDEALVARLMKKGVTDYVVKNRETLELLPKFFGKYLLTKRRNKKSSTAKKVPSETASFKTVCAEWNASLSHCKTAIKHIKDKKLQKQFAAHLKQCHKLAELLDDQLS